MTYLAIRRALRANNRLFYSYSSEISKRCEKTYCAGLKVPERSAIVHTDVMCALLQTPDLVKSFRLAPAIIPQVKFHVYSMINMLVYVHNYFVIHQNDDPCLLHRLLDDVSKKAECHAKSIKVLCDMLVESSDFTLKQPFILGAACVNALIFISDHALYRFNSNMCNKSELLVRSRQDLCLSAGVKGRYLVNMDFAVGKPEVDMGFWFNLLGGCCDVAGNLYDKFLHRDLKQKYHCSYEEVLFAITDASFDNPEGDTFKPVTRVLICQGNVRIIREEGSMEKVTELSNDVLQQPANMDLGMGLNSYVPGPSSGVVQQQSYNQTGNQTEKAMINPGIQPLLLGDVQTYFAGVDGNSTGKSSSGKADFSDPEAIMSSSSDDFSSFADQSSYIDFADSGMVSDLLAGLDNDDSEELLCCEERDFSGPDIESIIESVFNDSTEQSFSGMGCANSEGMNSFLAGSSADDVKPCCSETDLCNSSTGQSSSGMDYANSEGMDSFLAGFDSGDIELCCSETDLSDSDEKSISEGFPQGINSFLVGTIHESQQNSKSL